MKIRVTTIRMIINNNNKIFRISNIKNKNNTNKNKNNKNNMTNNNNRKKKYIRIKFNKVMRKFNNNSNNISMIKINNK